MGVLMGLSTWFVNGFVRGFVSGLVSGFVNGFVNGFVSRLVSTDEPRPSRTRRIFGLHTAESGASTSSPVIRISRCDASRPGD